MRPGVGFDHDAGTIVPCSVRVEPHDSQVGEIRPVTHCQEVSGLLGLTAAASNMVTFGLLSAETCFACSRSRGAAGAGAGSSLSSRTLATDASLNGWGAVMSGRLACGLWSGRHLMWHINCLEMLALFLALNTFSRELRDRHVLVRTGNTAVVSYINHQGGLCSRHLYRLAHQILGWSQGKVLSLRTVHIPGHLNMVVDILSRQGPSPGEWMLHPEVVKQTWRVWLGSGGHVCDSRDIALSPLVLSDPSSSTGAGSSAEIVPDKQSAGHSGRAEYAWT